MSQMPSRPEPDFPSRKSSLAPVAPSSASDADPFDAGPYTRLQAMLHLPLPVAAKAALRRGLVVAAVVWVPLLLLSTVEGYALRDNRYESFLLDISAHVRYLIAIPLLLFAEPWCLPRLATLARNIRNRGLIFAEDQERFAQLLASARRLLDNRGLEVGVAVAAYVITVVTSGVWYPREISTWVAPAVGGESSLSIAGWWRMLVSQPVFLLICGAWIWRIGVWARFLWGVSRLQLRLVPSHPDQMGGLRFLTGSLGAFAPIALSMGVVVAGTIAKDIVVGGVLPREPRNIFMIQGTIAFTLFILAGPLIVFTERLRVARLRGMAEYGSLAFTMGRRFEERWLPSAYAFGSEALDANDFSATTDLYSIVSNALSMKRVPVGIGDLLPLALVTFIPFLPLIVLVVPVNQILQRLAAIFL